MPILGIDYGAKKIGLALSGVDDKIALPLKILQNFNKEQVLADLSSLCQENDIKKIVIGIPISLKLQKKENVSNQNDLQNQQLKEVLNFIDWLKMNLKIQIEIEDERLSTKMAQGLIRGVEKNGADDAVAAMLILQTYLDKLDR